MTRPHSNFFGEETIPPHFRPMQREM